MLRQSEEVVEPEAVDATKKKGKIVNKSKYWNPLIKTIMNRNILKYLHLRSQRAGVVNRVVLL